MRKEHKYNNGKEWQSNIPEDGKFNIHNQTAGETQCLSEPREWKGWLMFHVKPCIWIGVRSEILTIIFHPQMCFKFLQQIACGSRFLQSLQSLDRYPTGKLNDHSRRLQNAWTKQTMLLLKFMLGLTVELEVDIAGQERSTTENYSDIQQVVDWAQMFHKWLPNCIRCHILHPNRSQQFKSLLLPIFILLSDLHCPPPTHTSFSKSLYLHLRRGTCHKHLLQDHKLPQLPSL